MDSVKVEMDSVKVENVEIEDEMVENELGRYEIKTEAGSDFSAEMDWCISRQNSFENNNGSGAIFEDIKNVKKYESTPHFVYECSFCTQALVNKKDVYCHNLTHLRVLLKPLTFYHCDYCKDNFVTKILLTSHIYSSHKKLFSPLVRGRKTYECNICSKKFTYKHLHEHTRNVHSQQKFKCKKCNNIYKSRRTYSRHPCIYKREYKDAKLKYKDAKLKYKDAKLKYKGVKLKYQGQEQFLKCEVCSKEFSYKTQLSLHKKYVHNIIVKDGQNIVPSQKLDCELCGSVFKSVSYLQTHIRRVHYDDGKTYSCPQCGKKFRSPRRVRIHIQNNHTPRRKCEICLKVIKTQKGFEEHLKKCIKTEDIEIKEICVD